MAYIGVLTKCLPMVAHSSWVAKCGPTGPYGASPANMINTHSFNMR